MKKVAKTDDSAYIRQSEPLLDAHVCIYVSVCHILKFYDNFARDVIHLSIFFPRVEAAGFPWGIRQF